MVEGEGTGGGEGTGEGGGGAGEGGTTTEFDVVVDGETVKVPLAELTGGYLRQKDYTKKTTELSERKGSMDKHIEDRATELYLQAQAKGEEGGGEGEEGGGEGEGELTDKEKKFQARVEKLEKSNQSAREERQNVETDKEISGIIKGLKKDFPLADERLIRLRVHAELEDGDNVQQVFERIAKEEHEGIKKRDVDNINEYIKTKRVPHSSGESGGSGSGMGGKTVDPPKTFKEAKRRSIEMMKNAQ